MNQIVKYPAKVLLPIKKFLEDRQKKLLKQKEEIKKNDPINDADRLNSAATDARAAGRFGHERSVAVGSELDKMLISVKKSLTKIKIGKYGLCDECGGMIDTDRLAIDPSAQKCVNCAKKKK
ncbi:TraR/DksA family transcriptional regulator [Patescibacteria group bacterium]